jgi:hypothetical protein
MFCTIQSKEYKGKVTYSGEKRKKSLGQQYSKRENVLGNLAEIVGQKKLSSMRERLKK